MAATVSGPVSRFPCDEKPGPTMAPFHSAQSLPVKAALPPVAST